MKKEKIYRKRIGVTFTKPYLDCMDYLVDQGIYLDHQEIIRDSVRLNLGSYGLWPFYPQEIKTPESSKKPKSS